MASIASPEEIERDVTAPGHLHKSDVVSGRKTNIKFDFVFQFSKLIEKYSVKHSISIIFQSIDRQGIDGFVIKEKTVSYREIGTWTWSLRE